MLIESDFRAVPYIVFNPLFLTKKGGYCLDVDQLEAKWGHVFCVLRKESLGSEMFESPVAGKICREAPIMTLLQALYPDAKDKMKFSAIECGSHQLGHLRVQETYIRAIREIAPLYCLKELPKNMARGIGSHPGAPPLAIITLEDSKRTILNFNFVGESALVSIDQFKKELEVAKRIGQQHLKDDVYERISLFTKEVARIRGQSRLSLFHWLFSWIGQIFSHSKKRVLGNQL